MPNRDATGPEGEGPNTGRERGDCPKDEKKKKKKSNFYGSHNYKELLDRYKVKKKKKV